MTTPAEQWEAIHVGYGLAGDSLPMYGGLVWRALPAGDRVKVAVEIAHDLGVWEDVKRRGPTVARALFEMRGSVDE